MPNQPRKPKTTQKTEHKKKSRAKENTQKIKPKQHRIKKPSKNTNQTKTIQNKKAEQKQ